MSLVAKTILGLIPLLRLLLANLVLELSMQILPHAPLVALVYILSTRLKLAKTASEPSVKTKRRALRAEKENLMPIMNIFLCRHNGLALQIKHAKIAVYTVLERSVKTS